MVSVVDQGKAAEEQSDEEETGVDYLGRRFNRRLQPDFLTGGSTWSASHSPSSSSRPSPCPAARAAADSEAWAREIAPAGAREIELAAGGWIRGSRSRGGRSRSSGRPGAPPESGTDGNGPEGGEEEAPDHAGKRLDLRPVGAWRACKRARRRRRSSELGRP